MGTFLNRILSTWVFWSWVLFPFNKWRNPAPPTPFQSSYACLEKSLRHEIIVFHETFSKTNWGVIKRIILARQQCVTFWRKRLLLPVQYYTQKIRPPPITPKTRTDISSTKNIAKNTANWRILPRLLRDYDTFGFCLEICQFQNGTTIFPNINK